MRIEKVKKEYDCLYISPHLDDVVFSCSAQLLKDIAMAKNVLSVTIFSESENEKQKNAFAQRHLEEAEASKIGNFDYMLAGFNDIRKTKKISYDGLIWSELTEIELIKNVRDWLQDLLCQVNPANLYVPLGVGRHIDHRIVQKITSEIITENNFKKEVWHYEDRPYTLATQSVNIRLRELGYDIAVDYDTFLNGIFESPHMKRMANKKSPEKLEQILAKNRTFIENIATENLKPIQGTKHVVGNPEQVWQLISAYQSQLPMFVGDKNDFFLHCKEYADKINRDDSYVERYWQLQ